jgi:hypothetical protein
MNFIIEESLMRKLFMLLNSNGHFNSNDYEINILFQEANKFSTKFKRNEQNKRDLVIKYPKHNKDREFYTKLESYLRLEREFDLWVYSYKQQLQLIETYTLFSILHEFGHVIEYIDRINHGGDYLNRDEMIELSRYWEVSKIQDLNERFIAYRKIDKEFVADGIAIQLMNEYKKELKLII